MLIRLPASATPRCFHRLLRMTFDPVQVEILATAPLTVHQAERMNARINDAFTKWYPGNVGEIGGCDHIGFSSGAGLKEEIAFGGGNDHSFL